MKKPIKINVILILCAIAPLAACISCGKVFTLFGKTDTAGIILEDREIFFNLTEKFEWIEYKLQNGDTIDLIGRKFKISGSIINSVLSRDGKTAKIPSMSGISHIVENSDTVSLLSRKYHVPQEVIMSVNGIINDTIDEDKLFIPNPYILDNFFDSANLKERFIYPIQSIITRPFGWQYDSATDTYSFHSGIDLHVETGTPVRAVMTGIVYDLGNDPIHGKYVILQHDNHYFSLYSNLSDVSLGKGSYVRQGKIIGEAGNTVVGTESHLHYGIFRGYNALNPQGMIIDNNEYEFDDIDGFIVQTVNDDNGNAIRIVSYMGSNTDVRIPNTINNLPVREIGDMAFFERGLTSVTIPDSVTYIGSSAFNTNKLKRLTIPDSVTIIDSMAFANNELTNVIIPDSVVSIGMSAFYRNKISRLTLTNSVTAIGGGAFSGNKLTRVTIPYSVTDISGAFSDNKLTRVTIPDSVTVIGAEAFSGNKLTRITIPNNVTSIGSGAFSDNKLKSVTIPDSVTFIDNMAFTGNNITRITINAGVVLEKRRVHYDGGFEIEYGAFGLRFDDFYLTNGSKAGVYLYRNGSWDMKDN